LECLKSIFEEYEKELKSGEFEIILVDNASTDGTTEAVLHLKIPNTKVIKNKDNFGFSKGNNLGVKAALGKSILFLNSDTEVKDKGFVKMVEFLDNNKHIAIVGGRMENENGSVQPSAGKFYSLFNLFLMLIGGERLGLLRKSPVRISKVDWISGACMMVKGDVFKKIGGFDEKLFMYMEDVELCFRAKKRGFLTYYYPFLSLIHKERGSSNKTFAIIHIYEGVLHFYSKYKPKWQYDLARLLLLIKAIVVKNIGRIVRNDYYINTYGQALELLKK
jgi:GT2 family glycosyltransferase